MPIKIKIALVHEFLTQLGGAEKVLLELLKIFPDAPVYTLIYDRKKCGTQFGQYNIRTSWLQKIPGAVKYYKKLLFLFPRATERFDLSSFQLILSNSSAFAKGVKTGRHQIHICYCHTPTRYLWTEKNRYVKANVPSWLRPLVNWFLPRLKQWDFKASQRPDILLANSCEVQKRIKRYYQRSSQVLYPPVELTKFKPKFKKQRYFLLAGRLVSYKRNDIVIQAFNRLSQEKLIVAGEGPELDRLKKISRAKNIQFLGRVSDQKLVKLYQNAQAYIFPALEDFGITPLEAMACATPVIAFGRGGAKETVKAGVSGIFFNQQTPQAIVKAVQKFQSQKFELAKIRPTVLKFGSQKFRINIKEIIKNGIKRLSKNSGKK